MSERTDALHIFTNKSGNYNKLSDGEPIGESIISDLLKYFITLFKYEYRYNYYNWQKIYDYDDDDDDDNNIEKNTCYYDLLRDSNFKIKSKIINFIKKNPNEFRIEIPEEVINSESNINYIRDGSFEDGKYPYLKVKKHNKDSFCYYIPDITINENYREKALLKIDLIKLNELFKSYNYKSIDELFILDFYKDFKSKIDTLKNKIIIDDDSISTAIKEDIIKKLKIIYNIANPNKKMDNMIEKQITSRAQKLADLDIFYNKIEGGEGGNKDVTINTIEDSNDLNEIINIINSINNDQNEINSKKHLKIDIDNHDNEADNIADYICPLNYDDITSIIKNNTKKYKKYLAIIYFIKNITKKTSGGALPNKAPLNNINKNPNQLVPNQLVPNQQVPNQQVPNQQPIKNNIEQKSVYTNNYDTNNLQTSNILDVLINTYINLVNRYIDIYSKAGGTDEQLVKYKKYIKDVLKNDEDEDGDETFNNNGKGSQGSVVVPVHQHDAVPDHVDVPEEEKDLSILKAKVTLNIKNLKIFHEYLIKTNDYIISLLTILNSKLNDLKNIPYATEYIEYINNIKNIFKLDYINRETKNYCLIIKDLQDYSNKVLKLYDTSKQTYDIYINSRAYYLSNKQTDPKLLKTYNDLNKDINEIYLIEKSSSNNPFINLLKLIEPKGDLFNLIELLKETNHNNIYNSKNVKNNDNDEESELIYEKIWNDYNNGISSNNTYNGNSRNFFRYIDEGEKLKNSIIINDLDPEIVLKVTIQDKIVFILLIFIIRTISIVIIELLIEYNILKSLLSAIITYILLYLTILLLFIIFINLDSYKLRIIFNYVNMHANTSNIVIHIVLFSIFAFLVIILIQTDNYINNVIDIFDYTYIYNYLFDFSFGKMLNSEFENNISPDEKIKLFYRLDIVSMIIFIFTGMLVILI